MIKMQFNSVDRERNRLYDGINVLLIRVSLCACAANFRNLIRNGFDNCTIIKAQVKYPLGASLSKILFSQPFKISA